jgi:O-antigen/teichoic acid export membrane protein
MWMQPVFASIGKPEWTVEVVVIALAVKLGLLVFLVPRLAEMGLALANTIYNLIPAVLGPLYVVRVRNHVRLPSFKGVARQPALGS